MLNIYEKFRSIIANGLYDNSGFNISLDKACREFFNRNSICLSSDSKCAELFAKYCDSILGKSSEVKEETNIEQMLDRFFLLFKYIDDKDVFQKFYSKLLSRRLINGISVGEDIEFYVISKLREICGYEYTSKLQRMFTDINVSRELNQSFSRYLNQDMGNQVHGSKCLLA